MTGEAVHPFPHLTTAEAAVLELCIQERRKRLESSTSAENADVRAEVSMLWSLEVAAGECKDGAARTQAADPPDVVDRDLAQRCWQELVRVDRIVHLPVQGTAEASELHELASDDEWFLTGLAVVLQPDPARAVESRGALAAMSADEFNETLAMSEHLAGWLVECSTPSRRRRSASDATSFSFSWGTTMARWFHGPTYHDAVEQAIAWAGAEPDELYETETPAIEETTTP